MSASRHASVTAALVLIALATAGCSRTVFVQPECEPAPRPVLPEIEAERLSALGDDTYWMLEDRERRIVDWGLENEAILNEVCSG